MANAQTIRITRELAALQKGSDLSITAACRDSDVRHMRALIIGPPDTPYEFGFFEFVVKFGKEYPTKPPSVCALTTNGGMTRFNPNIYAAGKVCLSILGTWRGERGEEWSAAQGLESILLSIQSLMSSNPYENEPGFEDSDDKEAEKAYAAKIFHETIRVSIIERMEDYLGLKMLRLPDPTKDRMMILKEMWKPDESSEGRFEPFRDMCKLRFLWYYDSYLLTIDREAKLHPDGKKFPSMDFENVGNSMDGTYQYSQLRRRLELVKKAMDEELTQWTAEGQLCVQKELPFAAQLVQMQEQVIELYKQKGDVALHIELENDNPFVWNLVLLGRPMTNLEGGIIKIRMHISPRFPQEQPRVQVVTPLFHHRVAEQGQLCYLLRGSSDDLRMHIESIITAISDPDPPYDPRTLVNPVASKLYWGSEEDKRLYNRKLRRSVQESAEYM